MLPLLLHAPDEVRFPFDTIADDLDVERGTNWSVAFPEIAGVSHGEGVASAGAGHSQGPGIPQFCGVPMHETEALKRMYGVLGLEHFKTEVPVLTDPHLLLGVTRVAAQAMKQEVMRGYDRASWFASQSRHDFITQNYGEDETGYDVAEATKKWLVSKGYQRFSVAESWLLEGREGVGRASVFLSHAQVQPFHETIHANEFPIGDDNFLWIDYFVLRQLAPDFAPEVIHAVVNSINCTLAVEDGDDRKSTYLGRSFCIFEVACTPEESLKFPMSKRRLFIADAGLSGCWRIALLAAFGVACVLTAVGFLALAFRSWLLAGGFVIPIIPGVVAASFTAARTLGTVGRDYDHGAAFRLFRILVLGAIVAAVFCTAFIIWGTVRSHGIWWVGVLGYLLLAIGSSAGGITIAQIFQDSTALLVDAKNATATVKSDKDYVDRYIIDKLDGFKAVDRRTKRALRAALRTSRAGAQKPIWVRTW